MPTLFVLRHAKSDWNDAALADHDRPLAPRGRRAAAALADHFRRSGLAPALVLCSSARRTQETLAPIREVLPAQSEVVVDRELYAADAEILLSRLRQVPDGTASVLLVGHNPGVQDLALALTDSGEPAALARLGGKMATGALATLRIPGQWRDLAPAGAVLVDFVVPKDLPDPRRR